MKMKKSLLMVVFLLALSSVMAAMSFSSAKVTNAMEGTVTETSESLLTFRLKNSSNNVHDHSAAFMDGGVLNLNFDNGRLKNNGQPWKFGLQRDSVYVWENLFEVKNQSENRVSITIGTESQVPAGVKISVNAGDGFKEIGHTAVSFGKMGVADSKHISIKVEVDKNAELAPFTPNLVFNAQ